MIKASLVTEAPDNSGFSPYHCHPEIEINHFLGGSGKYLIIDREYGISPGDTFIFASNIIHRITAIDPDCEMKILKVHFDPSLLMNRSGAGVCRELLDMFYSRSSGDIDRILHASSPYSDTIREKLLEMVLEYDRKQYKYEDMLESCLLGMLICIIRSVSGKQHQGPRGFNDESYGAVCRVITHINENLTENLCLDDLARIANMSKNNLLLQFRRYTGMSPYSFILSKRIAMAVELLPDSGYTVTEIAYKCGFNNTVSFNKAFRSVTGRTPSGFRNRPAATL